MNAATPTTARPSQALAIASLVLGILSVTCLLVLTGIPAIITGHQAYGRARRSPERYAGAGLAMAGLILGYLSILLTVVAAGAFLPAMASARSQAQSIACVNNLKQVGLAVRLYANDHKEVFPTDPAKLGKYLGTSRVLICPADPGAAGLPAAPGGYSKSSYQFTLEGASAETPDRVIAECPIHHNTVRADGSVQRGGGR